MKVDSKVKHTPGPWAAIKPGAVWMINAPWKNPRTNMSGVALVGAEEVARGVEQRRDPAMTEANAHLIAAAPTMLEALEHLLDMTQQGWITPENKPTDWQLGWEAATEQFKIAQANDIAKAAIKLAKGESL